MRENGLRLFEKIERKLKRGSLRRSDSKWTSKDQIRVKYSHGGN